MIILDTNVVSEPLRPRPDARVLAWLDAQSVETLFLTSVSLSELWLGVALLPKGQRRTRLADAIEDFARTYFEGRILPFDSNAAKSYADVMASARVTGASISIGDAQIAAIALTQGYRVATRDTTPFSFAGVEVIDPWS
jgi:predicted nucleic acid-binding protein